MDNWNLLGAPYIKANTQMIKTILYGGQWIPQNAATPNSIRWTSWVWKSVRLTVGYSLMDYRDIWGFITYIRGSPGSILLISLKCLLILNLCGGQKPGLWCFVENIHFKDNTWLRIQHMPYLCFVKSLINQFKAPILVQPITTSYLTCYHTWLNVSILALYTSRVHRHNNSAIGDPTSRSSNSIPFTGILFNYLNIQLISLSQPFHKFLFLPFSHSRFQSYFLICNCTRHWEFLYRTCSEESYMTH